MRKKAKAEEIWMWMRRLWLPRVTWGDIADFDIMKLSELRITAAPMFGGNWTQGVTCSSTSRQPLVDEVVERKPTRTIPVCVPTMKPKVSQYLLTPRALSPFRHAMTTPRKTLIHWNGFIPNTWCQYTDTASNCRCQYPDLWAVWRCEYADWRTQRSKTGSSTGDL